MEEVKYGVFMTQPKQKIWARTIDVDDVQCSSTGLKIVKIRHSNPFDRTCRVSFGTQAGALQRRLQVLFIALLADFRERDEMVEPARLTMASARFLCNAPSVHRYDQTYRVHVLLHQHVRNL